MISLEPVAETDNQTVRLSEEEVGRILDLYRTEHRYIANAKISNLKLRCMILPSRYPYTEHEVFSYVTAPTATLYIAQMAYVLIGGLVLSANASVSKYANWKEFVRWRDHASLRFAEVAMRFRGSLSNSEIHEATMGITNIRRLGTAVFCTLEFSIGDRLFGQVHAVEIAEEQ
jgi:hypothetical protein